MNRTTRSDAWLPDFRKLIESHSVMRFEYGVHDCAIIVAKILKLARGIDPPIWTDTKSALKLLNKKTLLQWAIDCLGDPIPWGDCIIGDVAIARCDNDDARMRYLMCVFDGEKFIAPDERIGFRRVVESHMLVGWRM